MGGEHDTGDAEVDATPVEDGGDVVTWFNLISLGKCFADQHLVSSPRGEQISLAQVETVEFEGAAGRQGVNDARSRFGESRQIERYADFNAGFEAGHTGDGGEAFANAVRGTFERSKDIGEAVFFVVAVAGGVE